MSASFGGVVSRRGRVSLAELPGEMWGVTACFNPAGYRNRYSHFQIFSERVRSQGLKLLAVEVAFGDGEFNLDEQLADRIVRVRSNTVLWQKERLLNLAVEALPDSCDKVTWLDADLLFDNPLWVSHTSELLTQYAAVQPFEWAYWMAEGKTGIPHPPASASVEYKQKGAGALRMSRPDIAMGHPGFAWSARRSLLQKHGLYDRLIVGGGDVAMFWGISRPTTEWPVDAWLRQFCPPSLADDYRLWADGIYADVAGSFSYTPGSVFHLWHGSRQDRQYESRMQILREAEFDPPTDLALEKEGCWRWNSDKSELHRRVRDYFFTRREDGNSNNLVPGLPA